MSQVDFRAFDCDNHYYEAVDAFTRYIDPALAKRAMQWAEIDGRPRLLVGGRLNRFIPNPTFDPVSRPGALDEYFRGRNPRGEDASRLFGELDPIAERPEYRDRDARLRVMDAQGLEGAFFFPTLAVGMEQALLCDPPALMAAFRAFNRWMDDDWGFNYSERIFAAPYITLVDVDNAVRELETALARDARILVLGAGPITTPTGGRSPGDPVYDPFWARVNEAGITVGIHGGSSRYSDYLRDWGEDAEFRSFASSPFRALVSHSPIHDSIAAFLATAMFERFPNLRVASIETGSDWVAELFAKLAKSFGQTPRAYAEDPRDTFRRHVWVSPYYEDDLAALRDLIGADQMLMGSDWPHAEGLAEPTSYVDDLRRCGFDDAQCRSVMRDNGLGLSAPRSLASV